MERGWSVSLEGVVFWFFWLCLQIAIIGVSYFVFSSPDTCITSLTVSNAVLFLISVR